MNKGDPPNFLVYDPTSIIRPLFSQQLYIISIYTKDSEAQEKIEASMVKIEDEYKSTLEYWHSRFGGIISEAK